VLRDSDVVVVVPTYRPDKTTIDLVAELSTESVPIIVSDDASPCTSDPILVELRKTPNTTVIMHERNRGIARGLNDGLEHALACGARWLLTVDQDSKLPRTYLKSLLADAQRRISSGEKLGAIGARSIADASGDMHYPESGVDGFLTTEELIQTGTLWRVKALADFGGFDEVLGIDAVDAAGCLALRERGWVVGLHDSLQVGHRIGNARTVTIAGREVMITGHSPNRRATMFRNRLRLFPAEFNQSPRHAIRTVRRVVVNQVIGLILESRSVNKFSRNFRDATKPRQR